MDSNTVTAGATAVLAVITIWYAISTHKLLKETQVARKINAIEKKLEKVYSPMEEALTRFDLIKENLSSPLSNIGVHFDELNNQFLQIKRNYGHIIFKDTLVIQFYNQVCEAKRQFDADPSSRPKYDIFIANVGLLHHQISNRIKENIRKIEDVEGEISMSDKENKKESWDKFWELLIAILGIYFMAYTIAKDYVEMVIINNQSPEVFQKLLIFSGINFFILMVSLLALGYLIFKFFLLPRLKKP
ncbi:MAG: hypothetical protein WC568_07445 [Candidatus Methanoperedens sp.]